jgi:hypothetical protein
MIVREPVLTDEIFETLRDALDWYEDDHDAEEDPALAEAVRRARAARRWLVHHRPATQIHARSTNHPWWRRRA